jgi:hypothetical protein
MGYTCHYRGVSHCRRIFRSGVRGITVECAKLYNEELHNYCSSSDIREIK